MREKVCEGQVCEGRGVNFSAQVVVQLFISQRIHIYQIYRTSVCMCVSEFLLYVRRFQMGQSQLLECIFLVILLRTHTIAADIIQLGNSPSTSCSCCIKFLYKHVPYLQEDALEDLKKAIEDKDEDLFKHHIGELENLLPDDNTVREQLAASGTLCYAAEAGVDSMMEILLQKGVGKALLQDEEQYLVFMHVPYRMSSTKFGIPDLLAPLHANRMNYLSFQRRIQTKHNG